MTIAEHLLLPLGNSNGGRHEGLKDARELYETMEQVMVMRNKEEGVVSWRELERSAR